MKILLAILALLACAVCAGCASEYPYVDATWGHSVANMIRQQTLDPQQIAHPPALAPAIADGERMENFLKAHRKALPQGVSQSVSTGQFNAGGTQ